MQVLLPLENSASPSWLQAGACFEYRPLWGFDEF